MSTSTHMYIVCPHTTHTLKKNQDYLVVYCKFKASLDYMRP